MKRMNGGFGHLFRPQGQVNVYIRQWGSSQILTNVVSVALNKSDGEI